MGHCLCGAGACLKAECFVELENIWWAWWRADFWMTVNDLEFVIGLSLCIVRWPELVLLGAFLIAVRSDRLVVGVSSLRFASALRHLLFTGERY